MQKEQKNKQNDDWSMATLSEDERHNLLGFFGLLMEVDMRENPHLYEKQKENKE